MRAAVLEHPSAWELPVEEREVPTIAARASRQQYVARQPRDGQQVDKSAEHENGGSGFPTEQACRHHQRYRSENPANRNPKVFASPPEEGAQRFVVRFHMATLRGVGCRINDPEPPLADIGNACLWASSPACEQGGGASGHLVTVSGTPS